MSTNDKTSIAIACTLIAIASVFAGTILYNNAQNRALYLECLKTYERIAATSGDRFIGSGYCSRY
jgi:hypothetical protein